MNSLSFVSDYKILGYAGEVNISNGPTVQSKEGDVKSLNEELNVSDNQKCELELEITIKAT